MRFRKLPVEIEVVEQVDSPQTVETPEGTLQADEGDIILRGIHGEKYPIKPGIFAKTYAPADPDDLDAHAFYHDQTPDGVQVRTEVVNNEVQITGVTVDSPDDLDRQEWDEAVEFARELSHAIGLNGEPPFYETNGGHEGDP